MVGSGRKKTQKNGYRRICSWLMWQNVKGFPIHTLGCLQGFNAKSSQWCQTAQRFRGCQCCNYLKLVQGVILLFGHWWPESVLAYLLNHSLLRISCSIMLTHKQGSNSESMFLRWSSIKCPWRRIYHGKSPSFSTINLISRTERVCMGTLMADCLGVRSSQSATIPQLLCINPGSP